MKRPREKDIFYKWNQRKKYSNKGHTSMSFIWEEKYHLKIILTKVIFFKKLIKHEVFQSLK